MAYQTGFSTDSEACLAFTPQNWEGGAEEEPRKRYCSNHKVKHTLFSRLFYSRWDHNLLKNIMLCWKRSNTNEWDHGLISELLSEKRGWFLISLHSIRHVWNQWSRPLLAFVKCIIGLTFQSIYHTVLRSNVSLGSCPTFYTWGQILCRCCRSSMLLLSQVCTAASFTSCFFFGL